MATGPKVATNPLELLTPEPLAEGRAEPFINAYWGPGLCGSIAFAAIAFGNYATKRPMLAGIQKHLVAAGIGMGIGKYVDDNRKDYLAERDAVLRHYITLHIEEFPDFERKKFADVFEPWVPIR